MIRRNEKRINVLLTSFHAWLELTRAFGATERSSMPGPDGKGVMHAELLIGDSIIMMGEENQ